MTSEHALTPEQAMAACVLAGVRFSVKQDGFVIYISSTDGSQIYAIASTGRDKKHVCIAGQCPVDDLLNIAFVALSP